MSREIELTPEIESQILSFIRVGGYPHIAAVAAGVPECLWNQWLQLGKEKEASDPYTTFALKVEQAKAHARLTAEVAALKKDPRFWLKNGPGKETVDSPGWSAVVRPMLTQNHQTINVFMSPDFLQFMAILRAVLAPHPEALATLSMALASPAENEVKVSPQKPG